MTTVALAVLVHHHGDRFTVEAVDTDPQAVPHTDDHSISAFATGDDAHDTTARAVHDALNRMGYRS